MRKYETLMVLDPELPEAQIRETIDRAKRLIEELGGQADQVQEWGVRELAYEIRKLTRGYYVLIEYSALPGVLQELERTLKIADEVLRFISVAASTVTRKERSGKAKRNKTPSGTTPSSTDASAVAE
jgi:small subunit ribosomal protein S6